MGDEVRIREAGPPEYPRCLDVIRETFEYHLRALPDIFRPTDTPPPSLQLIEDLVDGGAGAFFIAEHGSEVVGIATVRLLATRGVSFLLPRTWGQVDTLGVAEAWRGRGIGRRLMEAAERWSRQRGATEVQLSVWDFNKDALAFYEATGYEGGYRLLRKGL